MTNPADCPQNTDPLKLVREGTSQDQRRLAALDPAHAPVNERTPAHGMVFAQSYAALLKYFDETNTAAADWVPFFGNDVSAQLALLAIEDIEAYKTAQKSWFDYLNNLDNRLLENALKDRLGFLYGSLATLAKQLDVYKESLPAEIALKGTLQNLIENQLAPALERLIEYYKGGVDLSLVHSTAPSPLVLVLRAPVTGFNAVLAPDFLSTDWSGGQAWSGYVTGIAKDVSVYGSGTMFERINHCASHALFTSIFDEFLKVLARVVSDAAKAVEKTLSSWDKHEPHYALFLAFLRLFEYARTAGNTLTGRHLDFYYREILRFKEKGAEPGHVHLLAELAKQAASREFKAGELFKAGKDALGRDAFFANERDFVANQAKVRALKTVYRHRDEEATASFAAGQNKDRLYASPVANSDDGLGAALTAADLSWHPFFNKAYANGELTEIRMPEAGVGFAIASHYLLMAEGTRTITVDFTLDASARSVERKEDIACFLTAEKEWFTVDAAEVVTFATTGEKMLRLEIALTGAAPSIVPYAESVHGYGLATNLPVLLVKLRHRLGEEYIYWELQPLVVKSITLKVEVRRLKTHAISNDFGPVDASKPYQPFGPIPARGNSVVIGSKEVFQKSLVSLDATVRWQTDPVVYSGTIKAAHTVTPKIDVELLSKGKWENSGLSQANITATTVPLKGNVAGTTVDAPDFSPNDYFTTDARHGFARLVLSNGFGHTAYQADLINYLVTKLDADKPKNIPLAPSIGELVLNYAASTTLELHSADQAKFDSRAGRFFHLTPFGTAEQHPYLMSTDGVPLLPQFSFNRDGKPLQSEAESYIGVTGLVPPQNLSLLFQVAEGTANPLAVKPEPHVHWSYLKSNQWIGFAENEVEDGTGELLNSGIVTFSVPREASADNTLLPSGMVWIRAAIHDKSDAVCRLQAVAAQALRASFIDKNNSPSFPAVPLPAGTISKLDQPDAAVKSIGQPFASFGGRGAEQAAAFYMRVAERLRHKDRALSLWDYEHLILESFPQIYKVKCLNHTRYEPTESGLGIYRELAPGHVTIVTIPKLDVQNKRHPLKPYTSLGLLDEIHTFLKKRASCFAQLHVRNPQFEEVWVRFKLRLRAGFDTTYYSNVLQQAITRFLSPWAFTEGGSPSFGGKIYKSVLINFVEEQPYVDYVTDFELFRGLTSTIDLNEVEGSTTVSILVSAPASSHKIDLIVSGPETAASETCSCES